MQTQTCEFCHLATSSSTFLLQMPQHTTASKMHKQQPAQPKTLRPMMSALLFLKPSHHFACLAEKTEVSLHDVDALLNSIGAVRALGHELSGVDLIARANLRVIIHGLHFAIVDGLLRSFYACRGSIPSLFEGSTTRGRFIVEGWQNKVW